MSNARRSSPAVRRPVSVTVTQPARRAPEARAPKTCRATWILQKAGGLVAPAAHRPARFPHRRCRRARSPRRASATRSRRTGRSSVARPVWLRRFGAATWVPSDVHAVPWNTDELVAAANLQQTLLLWVAARAHRPRGRVRVPLRALQHRRPGPVPRRLDRGGDHRDRAPADGSICRRCAHRSLSIVGRDARGRFLAGIAGLLKATVGAHEVITTIMLNWIVIWVGSYLFGIGGPLQNDACRTHSRRRTTSPRQRSCRCVWGDPDPAGPARRALRRARRSRRLLR